MLLHGLILSENDGDLEVCFTFHVISIYEQASLLCQNELNNPSFLSIFSFSLQIKVLSIREHMTFHLMLFSALKRNI